MRCTSALVFCAILLGCGARTDTEDLGEGGFLDANQGGFIGGLGGAVPTTGGASGAGLVPTTTVATSGSPSRGGTSGSVGGRTVNWTATGGWVGYGGTSQGYGSTYSKGGAVVTGGVRATGGSSATGGASVRTRGGSSATGGSTYTFGGRTGHGGSTAYGGVTSIPKGGSIAFGGSSSVGGTSVGSGGQVPWTTAAGGLGNILVQACTTTPVNECQRCQCTSCGNELRACAADDGCTQLLECALLNRCTALECFTSGPCLSTLTALGGIMSPSVPPALKFGLCLSSSNCPC